MAESEFERFQLQSRSDLFGERIDEDLDDYDVEAMAESEFEADLFGERIDKRRSKPQRVEDDDEYEDERNPKKPRSLIIFDDDLDDYDDDRSPEEHRSPIKFDDDLPLGIPDDDDYEYERNPKEHRSPKFYDDYEDERSSLQESRSPIKFDDDMSLDFDVDLTFQPPRIIKPIKAEDDVYYMHLYARCGLQCYNLENGTNFKFVRLEKFSLDFLGFYFSITLEAMDPSRDNSVFSFQTLINETGCVWTTLASRIKCNKPVDESWNSEKIKKFYKREMPKWLSNGELKAGLNKKYYVVPESELHDNDWLHLLMEFAFTKSGHDTLESPPPLEIKKVVVETKEDATREPCEKLKAKNAIFYISYKFNSDDYKAIVRKTMDGKPEHMKLEAANRTEEKKKEKKNWFARR